MEVRHAWQRYLMEVREADAEQYERAEERAWRRLVSNLSALGVPLRAGGADEEQGLEAGIGVAAPAAHNRWTNRRV